MKAFTLIEALASTVIFSVIIVAIFLVLSIGQRSWITGDVSTQLRQGIIRSIITMDRELSVTRPAKTNLALGASSNSITFYLPSDNNGDGSVIDSLGNIEWSAAITYSRDASNNLIRNFGGVTSVLARDITSLQFSRTQFRLIEVDITARKTDSAGRLAQDIEKAVIKMRN